MFRDPTLWSLLVSNAITIWLAVAQDWSLSTVLWVYWLQSLIIGFFAVLQILNLKDFSTEGYRLNGRQPPATTATKWKSGLFFMLHFGFFHVLYAFFILVTADRSGGSSSDSPFVFILLGGLAFFCSHLFSFVYNFRSLTTGQNIGSVMFRPYIRILPMHIVLIFGSTIGSAASLIGFLLLKTLADAAMHATKRHKSQKPSNNTVLQ